MPLMTEPSKKTSTMAIDVGKLAIQYRDELLNEVIPFWVQYSPDREFGGYFSCLDAAVRSHSILKAESGRAASIRPVACFSAGKLWRQSHSPLVEVAEIQ